MKLPHQVQVIVSLLRNKAKITGSGPRRKVAGRTFEAKHVQMAKQVLYIARLERRKMLDLIPPVTTESVAEPPTPGV